MASENPDSIREQLEGNFGKGSKILQHYNLQLCF